MLYDQLATKDGPIFTVATACRNDGKGLWFTLHSAIMETIGTEYEGRFRFAVVNNSDDAKEREYIRDLCARFVSSAHMTYAEEDFLSNHKARNAALNLVTTPYAVLCDSHVLFGRNFFQSTVGLLQKHPSIGMVHTPFCTMGVKDGDRLASFYNLQKFEGNMHGSFSRCHALWDRPYPVAIAPHAAVAVRTAQWKDFGGYIESCEGHGGGEPFVTYKYWLYGSSVWVNPASVYSHWRHASYHKSKPGWLRNMTITAYALWGRGVGDQYAANLRHSKQAEELWAIARPYHEQVCQRTNLEYKDFLPYLKEMRARPLSAEMPLL